MLDFIKQYVKGRAREATLYACLLTAALPSGGCAVLDWYGKSYIDFHTKPLETIRDNPLGAATAIGTDVGIIALVSGNDGGGAAGPGPTPAGPGPTPAGPGPTPGDPD